MSRIARKPLEFPKTVNVNITDNVVTVKGKKGELIYTLSPEVKLEMTDNVIWVRPTNATLAKMHPMVGTTCVLLSDMVKGVDVGFEIKLQLVGVGYRAKVVNQILDLSLGFSHPVNFEIPEGITIETPVNTEVIVRGSNKQQVGQVAANIRRYRPPEPYKGKGIRYSTEKVVLKETKKK